ncbi:MAG: DUF3667 domain-containing protein [bacterium]
MEKTKICKNCNSVNINNFCSDCGQKIYDKRFTIKSFIMDLLAVFNLERGFLYTAKMLLIRPGQVTNDYLRGKTKPYVNPLKYLLIIGGIYAFLILYLNIFDTGLEAMTTLQPKETLQNNSQEVIRLQNQWLNFYRKIINFIPLLMVPFISMITKWFYKSKHLFYGEHLIINSFLFVQSFLILIVLTPLVLIFPSLTSYFPIITVIVIFTYLSYSYKGAFGVTPAKSFWGTVFSLLIGYLLFLLFVIFIIFLIIIIIILTK